VAVVGSVVKISSIGSQSDAEAFKSLEYAMYTASHKRDLRAWPADHELHLREEPLYDDPPFAAIPTGKRRKLRLRSQRRGL
jgi:hypothetical protein